MDIMDRTFRALGKPAKCTHTSDWWKEMIHCACCGAEYSDEEAERIVRNAYARVLNSFESFDTTVLLNSR